MNRKAQSILEYMIILAVIVAAVIAGANLVKDQTKQGLSDATGAMGDATGKFREQIGE